MTLTEVNYYSRKFAPVLIILFLVFLIFFFGIRLLFLYLETQNPIPTEPEVVNVSVTDTSLGQLKQPIIPDARPAQNYSYVLDTFDGSTNIEEATSAAKVYFIPQKTASFGFLSKIYLMAKSAGFDTEVTQHSLDGRTAVFDDNKRRLTIDIQNFNFNYDYRITQDDTVAVPEELPSDAALSSRASSFLSAMDRYPTTLSQGDKNVIYMRLDTESNQITQLNSPEGANMAEVDFFPGDIDGLPVVTSSYYNSPHYVMYLLSEGSESIPVRAKVSYFEHTIQQAGSYPLRTPQQAWEDLQSGAGYVVSSAEAGGEVRIKKIFLAYYDPAVYQEFLQPVYVFIGENQFTAYVPAVAEEYIGG